MKKRIVGMLVVLVMICGILPAYAAGGIAPTEETWYVVSHSGDYRVYYYAAVTNNSGEPEKIKDACRFGPPLSERWGRIYDYYIMCIMNGNEARSRQ